MIIAIDGPAGSGKSTVAKRISELLGIEYIDSGAIYRTLTLYGMKRFNQNCAGHEDEIADYFIQNPDQLTVTYENHIQIIRLQDKDVSKDIRTVEVTSQVRFIADNVNCRNVVNETMRTLATTHSVAIDGRDIGTVVFPSAKYKFFLDAQPRIRATRRAIELNIPPNGEAFDTLLNDMIRRDEQDMNRKIAPLTMARDARKIDTSFMSIEEVAEKMEHYIDSE